MTEYFYKAFGFVIRSEFPIAQLPTAQDPDSVDISFCRADLSEYAIGANRFRFGQNNLLFNLEDAGTFLVTDGNLVQADPVCDETLLGVYLMGSCMGAILHQRGFMPLHGSCVTDGERSVLITGDSGAGKSTLAAEFLSRGWKLLTDDVAAVFGIEQTPTVQSSYPSQKLWQDSLRQYDRPQEDIHSLYVSEDREKFGVDVTRFFQDGSCPLRLVVWLVPTEDPCALTPLEGFVPVDQLMKNTYRLFMVPPQQRQRQFQRCVTLAMKVPMVLLNRQKDTPCADVLYDLVLEYLN